MTAMALSALLVSCSGAEVKLPGPDSTTPPLSHAEYLAQANDICRATTKAIVERIEDVGSAGDSNRQKLIDATEPVSTLALTRLRNLTPPPEDAATARAAIDAMQAAADSVRTDPQAPLDPVGLNKPELFDFGLTGCFTKR
jgi:hypothetical protein